MNLAGVFGSNTTCGLSLWPEFQNVVYNTVAEFQSFGRKNGEKNERKKERRERETDRKTER